MTSIEAAICQHLADALAPSAGADVQGVWQLIIPQSAETPAVRVQLVSERRPPHLRGPAGTSFARIQTDVYVGVADVSDPYALATDIMEAVELALFPEPFQAGGSPVEIEVVGAFPQGRFPMYDPGEVKRVAQTQDFFVWWKRIN